MGFRQSVSGFLEGIGQKVKQGVEMFGKVKGLYETGKAIYGGVQALLPYAEQAAAIIPYVI